MTKVKLTVTKSECRGGYHKAGDTYVVEDLCPPLCHERWNTVYPDVFALLNGAKLDCGDTKAKSFAARCPDGGKVEIRGELLPEDGEDR